MLNLIDVLKEDQLIKEGKKPYITNGMSEFPAYSDSGIPLGFYVKVYEVDGFSGVSGYQAFSRAMTPEELNNTHIRASDGTIMATTLGEVRSNS